MNSIIKTGFEVLDNLFYEGGLKKGSLNLIGFRLSIEKTTLSLNIINNNLNNESIAFFSYDMSKNMILKRINELFNVELNDKKLFIYEDSNITIDDIINQCINLKESNNGLDLVIIDYMELIPNNEVDSINDKTFKNLILNKLWKLAHDYFLTIIVLTELPKTRENKRPIIDDFNLEENTYYSLENIIYLYKNSYYNNDNVEIGILKSRQCLPTKININLM